MLDKVAKMKITETSANQTLHYYKHMGTRNQAANFWRYELMILDVSTKWMSRNLRYKL